MLTANFQLLPSTHIFHGKKAVVMGGWETQTLSTNRQLMGSQAVLWLFQGDSNPSQLNRRLIYRLGAPPENMMYPAMSSTEYRNDNQPGHRIRRVKSLENSRLKCRSTKLIGITMTMAMSLTPFWPKLLYRVTNG